MSTIESELNTPVSDKETVQEGHNTAVVNLEDHAEKHKITSKNASETVGTARRTFNAGKTKSIAFRKQQLKNLLRLLNENRSDLLAALKMDLGRHTMESLMLDFNLCVYEVTQLIWNFEEWLKPEYPSKPIVNVLDGLSIRNEPYGVVLVIGSWNFPVNLLLGPVAGAIAAGNCVIMKPSEVVVHTEALLAKLVPRFLDQDCYHVYIGGAEETTQLLKERFDYIFFTGSTSVGKLVHAAANKYLTPVTLELGGKNPVYLDETVDMETAAARILFGKCCNAGQICIAPDYLLCTQSVQEKFVKAANDVLVKWYNNDAKASPDYCKIVSEKHYHRLVSFIQDKRDVAIGGKYDFKNLFIEPTILTNVSLDDKLMQEEIFGPILPIITVGHVRDAVAIINKREKPLVTYIFSNDKHTKELILNDCASGGVLINDTLTHFIVDTLPFGGVGFSGIGSYHGKNTLDTFVHKKSVLEKGYSFVLEKGMSFRYPPYNDLKIKVINQLTKPRKGISPSLIKTLVTFAAGILFVIIIQVLYHVISK